MKKVLFLLGALEHQDIEWLMEEGELKTIDSGEVLIQKGEEITHLFLTLSGSYKVMDDKKEIGEVSAGEILGEISFIDAKPPSVSIVTKEYSEFLSVKKELVKEKLQSDLGFAARFYYATSLLLSHRLRKATSNDASYEVDELDENIMDYIHQAGSRFTQILNQMKEKRVINNN